MSSCGHMLQPENKTVRYWMFDKSPYQETSNKSSNQPHSLRFCFPYIRTPRKSGWWWIFTRYFI